MVNLILILSYALCMNKKVTKILKYMGSKDWLVNRMKILYEKSGSPRFVELFSGSLALSIGMRNQEVLANDLNKFVINLFQEIKNGFDFFSFDFTVSAEKYKEYRSEFNDLISQGVESGPRLAFLFLYLNRTCFNGVCRFNRKEEFNVPFNKEIKVNFPRFLNDFPFYQNLFQKWTFLTGDFEAMGTHLKPNDFIYADPPYHKTFTQYYLNVFPIEEQQRLANFLAVHPGPVVASNSNEPEIVDIYERLGFTVHYDVSSVQTVNSKPSERGRIQEILVAKNLS